MVIIDMRKGVPMDGYPIHKLPKPKKKKEEKKKEGKKHDLNLELEIHDWAR